MKRIIVLSLFVVMTIVLVSCGTGDPVEKTKGNLTGIKATDLNIEDFEWSVDEAKINGIDCYALSLTNNSKYDLLGVQIQYRPKNDVTEKQLSVFEDVLKEHADYLDEGETTADVMLRGDRNNYVESGGYVSDVPLSIGFGDYTWYDIPDEDQFELMQPDELALGIIKGEVLYLAYYDIPDDKWKIDTNTVELNKWPSVEIAESVPKPNAKLFTSTSYENTNAFNVEVYGGDKEDFEAYVEEVNQAGYIDKEYSDGNYYAGEDEKGNSVSVTYNEYTNSYDINGSGAD